MILLFVGIILLCILASLWNVVRLDDVDEDHGKSHE
jgi:hypothetical protein